MLRSVGRMVVLSTPDLVDVGSMGFFFLLSVNTNQHSETRGLGGRKTQPRPQGVPPTPRFIPHIVSNSIGSDS